MEEVDNKKNSIERFFTRDFVNKLKDYNKENSFFSNNLTVDFDKSEYKNENWVQKLSQSTRLIIFIEKDDVGNRNDEESALHLLDRIPPNIIDVLMIFSTPDATKIVDKALSKNIKSLRVIGFEKEPVILSFIDLEQNIQNLTTLELQNVKLTNDDIAILSLNTSIKRLSIKKIVLENSKKNSYEQMISDLCRTKQIVTLSVTKLWSGVFIQEMPYLKQLHVNVISNVFCKTKFPSLQEISMIVENNEDSKKHEIILLNLEEFSKYPILSMRLSVDSIVMNTLLLKIERYKKLKFLFLRSILDDGNAKYELRKLPKLEQLKFLKLENFHIPSNLEKFDIGKKIPIVIMLMCKHTKSPTKDGNREINEKYSKTFFKINDLNILQIASKSEDYFMF
jgi:hypothetical protein